MPYCRLIPPFLGATVIFFCLHTYLTFVSRLVHMFLYSACWLLQKKRTNEIKHYKYLGSKSTGAQDSYEAAIHRCTTL